MAEKLNQTESSRDASDEPYPKTETAIFAPGTLGDLASRPDPGRVGARGRRTPNVLEGVRKTLIPALRRFYDLTGSDMPPGLVGESASRFKVLADNLLIFAQCGQRKCGAGQAHTKLEQRASALVATVFNDVEPRKQRRNKTGAISKMRHVRRTVLVRSNRKMQRQGLGLVLATLLGASPTLGDDLAFPGADGYGAITTGWRGGEIVRVTSLADEGPGSLRACAENGGDPRICVFAVSGTIVVDRPIMAGSNLYVAGQTAPGDGIQIRIGESTNTPLILKDIHDVVLRFLKLRPGPSTEPFPNIDALTIEDSERLYLGNLSMAFSTDETFNIHVSGGRAADITLADSLLALSLDKANHPKGRHSKGALICSKEGTGNECGRISLLRNLFAHHRDRNPDVKATSIGPVEVINNVFYDPISQFGEVYDLTGDLSLVYAGNVVLPGPSTIRETPEALQAFDMTDSVIEIAAWDNLSLLRDGCGGGRRAPIMNAAANAALAATSATTAATVLPAEEAFAHVMVRAGDVIPERRARDALDRRVIGDVSDCKGKVIDRVDQVGGWPDIAASETVADRDRDGLPDSWEESRPGLDPDRPDQVWSVDPVTGLSHVETWLAILAGDIPDSAANAQ